MPDGLVQAFATPGLPWLMVTIAIAGVVRGFSGFGTALIFVPVAGIFLPPAEVVFIITLTGIPSALSLLPKAWPKVDKREVGILSVAAMLMVPFGIWCMVRFDPIAIRWIVAFVAGLTLLALMLGWRYAGTVTEKGLAAIGGAAGFIGGMTGLTGPIVILFYLAGQRSAEIVRANTIFFLMLMDFGISAILLLRGLAQPDQIWLAVVISLPYLVGIEIGKTLFDPARETIYRAVAYGAIGVAVLSGLPIWTG